ncbi:MAG: hypothetical protein HYT75_05635 [Deltaproteobacteria bacterium]|nr:hypothetical protein [Deltaproteobacteria bacterium]
MASFKDHSILVGGGFGKTRNYFPSTDLQSGKTTTEQQQFGSIGAYYILPIVGSDHYSLDAQLGLVINFSGGDSEKVSEEMLDTNFSKSRITRTTEYSVSNLTFLDLLRIGAKLGRKEIYAAPALGFGYGWNDPRQKLIQTDVLEQQFYDSKIGYYWKETDKSTTTLATGEGETSSGAYGIIALGAGSRLGDIFGLYAEINKRLGFVDSWGGLLGAVFYLP